MKAFVAALFVLAVITVGANYTLTHMGWSSAEVYQSSNVRLD